MHSHDRKPAADQCATTVYQQIGVEAEVTVVPHVKCGKATVTCLASRLLTCDDESSDGRKPHRRGKYKVRVLQDLCVAIPVVFRVEASCRTGSVECGPAFTDPSLCFGDESDSSGGSSSSGSSTCSGSSSGGSSSCSSHSEVTGSSSSSSGDCSGS